MLGYIVRRIFLLIPTLFGITFMVFMLLALSPGGIGAGLMVNKTGQMEQSKAALIEAYLEDRYGLNDPAIYQYSRWLGRISPLKFGRRDQVNPSGDLLQPPKAVADPPLMDSWFSDLVIPDDEKVKINDRHSPIVPKADSKDSALIQEYKDAAKVYASKRAAYLVAKKALERAFARYSEQTGIGGIIGSDGKPLYGNIAEMKPDRTAPSWKKVQAAAYDVLFAFQNADAARRRVDRAFNQTPYPEDGIGISGLVSLALPDFGVSFSRGRSVKDLILAALPVTILLNLVALPIIYLVALPTGMLAARKRGSWFDIGSGTVFVALWSIPVIWAGVLLVGFVADKEYLGWFPVAGLHDKNAEMMTYLPSYGPGGWSQGYLLDTLWHIALPVLCLVYAGFAVLGKQTRAAMLDNLNQDYVRTAKAKGVPGRIVLMRHVFRNSLLPLITIFVSIFPGMLAGSVVVEQIFSIPGMGTLLIEAINLRDRELILANTFMIAAINLFALLLADILYAAVDPRVTYD